MSSNGMLRESSKDTRVEDYLDDKLQSPGDLDTLDALLENVISQQKLLKQQVRMLEDARRDSQDAQDQAMRQTARVQGTARQFQEEQGDIDRRLMIVTQSETSDEAVQRFKASMDVLWKIDVARGYAETLKEVEALHNVCASQLGRSGRRRASAATPCGHNGSNVAQANTDLLLCGLRENAEEIALAKV
ncbi:hypothetical protein LTR28_007768 [Elasticomyces elasticus]|nr:hypothetical protein LTR28_007768 [Elasticomyces elasticus]